MNGKQLDLFLDNDVLIRPRENIALYWLSKQIKVNAKQLHETLISLRLGTPPVYKVWYKAKSNGEKRQICAPCRSLKKIQRRINRYVLNLKPAYNVFGFSGGSIIDAIKPHLANKTMLCLDLKDAFPTIIFGHVFGYFTAGMGFQWLGHKRYRTEYGWFSWYVAKALTELTTYKGGLPQGAPTSPRLFDLLCAAQDKMLYEITYRADVTYTRYADNLFISVPDTEFPETLKREICGVIERQAWYDNPRFFWHKLKIKKLSASPERMLGLNLISEKIHNTRAFKKRLRLSIHHVNWLLEHGMADAPEFEEAWQRLRGQMQFARIDTLPKGLHEAYLRIQQQLG